MPVTFGLDPEPDTGIGRQTLPGGAFAVHTHVGSYAEIGELFSQLHREIVPKRGLSLDYDRPFVTIYLNDPASRARCIAVPSCACRFSRADAAFQQRRRGSATLPTRLPASRLRSLTG